MKATDRARKTIRNHEKRRPSGGIAPDLSERLTANLPVGEQTEPVESVTILLLSAKAEQNLAFHWLTFHEHGAAASSETTPGA
jgi:hypothetical protein